MLQPPHGRLANVANSTALHGGGEWHTGAHVLHKRSGAHRLHRSADSAPTVCASSTGPITKSAEG